MNYHMRRKEREIVATEELDAVLREGRFIVLGLCREGEPYTVALSYGFDAGRNCLYLHCAKEGQKLDFIRANPSVCGSVVLDRGYQQGECSHRYESVFLRGTMTVVTELEEKRHGLTVIMDHLEDDPAPLRERLLKEDKVYASFVVLRLDIVSRAGKRGS